MFKIIIFVSLTCVVVSTATVIVWQMYKQNVEWDVWATEFTPKSVPEYEIFV